MFLVNIQRCFRFPTLCDPCFCCIPFIDFGINDHIVRFSGICHLKKSIFHMIADGFNVIALDRERHFHNKSHLSGFAIIPCRISKCIAHRFFDVNRFILCQFRRLCTDDKRIFGNADCSRFLLYRLVSCCDSSCHKKCSTCNCCNSYFP